MQRSTLNILLMSTITSVVGTGALHAQSEKQELHDFSSLSIVQKLKSQLAEKPVVVFFATPSSGKSELMKIALDEGYETFELRSEFVNALAQERGVSHDKKATDALKKDAYYSMKKEECEWLSTNKTTLFDKLAKLKKRTIVFDEIDLWKGNQGEEFELATALMTINLARQLSKNGKQILLILHKEGLDSRDLNRMLRSELKLDTDQDIVKTGHFNKSEEELLLNTTSLKPEEKSDYMQRAQGTPAAYAVLLGNITDGQKEKNRTYEFDALVAAAHKKIMTMYNIAKTSDPATIEHFEAIVGDSSTAQKLTNDPKLAEELVNHGVVGVRDGGYAVSDLVKEAIKAKEKK